MTTKENLNKMLKELEKGNLVKGSVDLIIEILCEDTQKK